MQLETSVPLETKQLQSWIQHLQLSQHLHRVFLLLEPWNAGDANVRLLLERHHGREIARYPELWGGLPLYELTAP